MQKQLIALFVLFTACESFKHGPGSYGITDGSTGDLQPMPMSDGGPSSPTDMRPIIEDAIHDPEPPADFGSLPDLTPGRDLAPTDLGPPPGMDMAPPTDLGPTVSISFANPTTYSIGAAPNALSSGDFNGDGRPDIAVAVEDGVDLALFFNQGGGLFTRQYMTLPSSGRAIASGDVNGDGKSDLVLGGIAGGGSYLINILLAVGDGTFTASSLFTTAAPYGMAIGDLDGDSKADLVVANYASSPVTFAVYHGRGDGSFEAPANTVASGKQPQKVIIADVNGDGKKDVVMSIAQDSIGRTGYVGAFLNLGNGQFANQLFLTGNLTLTCAVADVNNDGHIDLLASAISNNTASVVLGLGSNMFKPTAIAISDNQVIYPIAMLAQDFDRDGNIDVALTSSSGTGMPSSIAVLQGSGSTSFADPVFFPTGANPIDLVAADFNDDGKLDVATVDHSPNSISVLLNVSR